jgi:hypothetical protein
MKSYFQRALCLAGNSQRLQTAVMAIARILLVTAYHVLSKGFLYRDLGPNYLVVIAHTVGKEVILLTQEMNDVPFDLRHLNVINYRWTPPGAEKLKEMLDSTLVAVLQREAAIRAGT